MTKDWTVAKVYEIPGCDFCDKKAEYDAATKFGPWAFMCSSHWELHGPGSLGLGRGQRLELES